MVKRYFLLPALVLFALVAAATTASATPTGSTTYAQRTVAALGDSFSSGVGTRVYDPTSGACQRSWLAYPVLAAALRHEALRFLACSGATTDDVVLRQVPALPADARLVTITVGGDDIGFAAVLTACSAGTQEACTTAINTALTELGNLPNKLALTYNAIHRQAPQAKLVVLGYPHIFGSGSCTAAGLPPLPARAAIDAGTDALDKVIAEVTGANGATYVDVRRRFQDHGTCAGPLRRWINAPTQPISESYHPNAVGHALGYLPALLPLQPPLAV